MKKITNLLLCFFSISICCLSCKNSSVKETENEQDGMLQAMHQEYLMTRDPRTNQIPSERLLPAFNQLKKIQASLRLNGIQALNWTERGPDNIGGRTRALLYDENDVLNGYKKVWAGSVGGGLWYTSDITAATPVWNKVNDLLSNLAVTTIAQDPSNSQYLYAGTGEGWFNGDAIRGLGIFHSTDGGSSWSQLSSTNNSNFYYVQKIVITSTGTVFACTRNSGLQRSTDNGTTWTKVLGNGVGGGSNDRAADIEIGKDGAIYCSIGIFTSDGIYRSTDNGTTWTKIYTSASDEKRIELACAPSNANYVYALVHQSTSTTDALKKIMYTTNSTAGTVTWTSPANPSWCSQGSTSTDFTNGQAWYDLSAAVDPNNENNAFIGGVDIMKTINGGAAWSQVSQWASGCSSLPYVHADIQTLVFKPGSSTEFLVGCDGGVFRTTDGGASFLDRNASYNVTQYYSLAINPSSANNYMLAGAQDNGSHKFQTGGINSVNTVTGGDGAFCFISQSNPSLQVTSYIYSNFYRSTNGGANFSTAFSNGSGRFINPADMDQNNILYFGNTDGSYGNYNVASGGSPNYNSLTSFATLTNLQVSAIKADTNTSNVIYCAFSTSENSTTAIVPKLLKVTNANGSSTGPPAQRPSATEITLPAFVAGSYISSIDVEIGNSNHLLLTLSNYGVVSVWESTNGGTSWNNIEGNLPDMPVRWGMFVPAGYGYKVMLATELGVWTTSSINGTSTVWAADNSGLANVRVDMLKLRPSDKTVGAATHGRGIFTTVLSSVLPVTLSDFSGQLNPSSIQLNWITSSEQNLKLFDVQKSMDSKNFYSIGRLAAHGNTLFEELYSLADWQVSEFNYYRLKMVDADGKSTYSKTILIKNLSVKQNVWLVNNPVSDYIEVRLAKQTRFAKLQLITSNGQMVSQKEWNTSTSELRWSLDSYLANGTYLLRVITDNQSFTRKLIKK